MTWTKDDFEKVYSRYLESGLSVRDFCFNEGINESRFFYWKKRTITSPEQGLQTPEGAFLPVDVVRRTRPSRTGRASCCWDAGCMPEGTSWGRSTTTVHERNTHSPRSPGSTPWWDAARPQEPTSGSGPPTSWSTYTNTTATTQGPWMTSCPRLSRREGWSEPSPTVSDESPKISPNLYKFLRKIPTFSENAS